MFVQLALVVSKDATQLLGETPPEKGSVREKFNIKWFNVKYLIEVTELYRELGMF